MMIHDDGTMMIHDDGTMIHDDGIDDPRCRGEAFA